MSQCSVLHLSLFYCLCRYYTDTIIRNSQHKNEVFLCCAEVIQLIKLTPGTSKQAIQNRTFLCQSDVPHTPNTVLTYACWFLLCHLNKITWYIWPAFQVEYGQYKETSASRQHSFGQNQQKSANFLQNLQNEPPKVQINLWKGYTK